MAAKVHKTLRLEESLVNRIETLRKEGEPFSLAVNRVLAVGCDTLENVARNAGTEHAETRAEHGESTQKIISLLEAENARLLAEHEADRAAISEKDEQLAAALTRAHDLAEQAHVLIGRGQDVKALPATGKGDGGAPDDGQPQAEQKKSWWQRLFE